MLAYSPTSLSLVSYVHGGVAWISVGGTYRSSAKGARESRRLRADGVGVERGVP